MVTETVVVTVSEPVGMTEGVVVTLPVTGWPMNKGVVADPPLDRVTVIVSVPLAKPVVSRFPRSTVSTLVYGQRDRHRGGREQGFPVGSVTVNEAETCVGSLTVAWILAETSTLPPAAVNGGVRTILPTRIDSLRRVSSPGCFG